MASISEQYLKKFDYCAEKIRSIFKIPISDDLIKKGINFLDHPYYEDELDSIIKKQNDYCIRCGECCRQSTSITVNKKELKRISRYLKTSYIKLKKKLNIKHLQKRRFTIPAAPCPFLLGTNRCKIYKVRPFVCKYFPFGELWNSFKLPGKVRLASLVDYCPVVDEILILRIVSFINLDLIIAKYGQDAIRKYTNNLGYSSSEKRFKLIYEHFSIN